MYKITMQCSAARDRHEMNPVGESLDFVRVAYTEDPAVAEYYKTNIGFISVEEVEKKD